MRWLQWSTIDLEAGLGGVEVHARALARELSALGVEARFSNDPTDLEDDSWDVIHTHGSAVPLLRPSDRRRRSVRLHTLHGTTLGRMVACRELAWPGGYAAALRELRGLTDADVVLTVHPRLSLATLARRVGKPVVDCGNGWDSAAAPAPLPEELRRRLPPKGGFWVFVGRGEDRVKGVDRLLAARRLLPELRLVAAPGAGFERVPEVVRTGKLSPAQVLSLYDEAAGLVLPSRYEGNSLALLEALARGLPVVTTPVGASSLFLDRARGLVRADSPDPRALADAFRAAGRWAADDRSRVERAVHNQAALPTWRRVAEVTLAAAHEILRRRASAAR